MTGRFFAKYLENVRKTHIIETEHLIGGKRSKKEKGMKEI